MSRSSQIYPGTLEISQCGRRGPPRRRRASSATRSAHTLGAARTPWTVCALTAGSAQTFGLAGRLVRQAARSERARSTADTMRRRRTTRSSSSRQMTRTMAYRNRTTWSSRTFSANTTSAGVETVAHGIGPAVLDEAVELESRRERRRGAGRRPQGTTRRRIGACGVAAKPISRTASRSRVSPGDSARRSALASARRDRDDPWSAEQPAGPLQIVDCQHLATEGGVRSDRAAMAPLTMPVWTTATAGSMTARPTCWRQGTDIMDREAGRRDLGCGHPRGAATCDGSPRSAAKTGSECSTSAAVVAPQRHVLR